MKRTLALLVSAFALAVSLQAQSTLTPSSSKPKPDGTMGASEYQFNTEVSGMTIGATLGTDGNLYLAVKATTSGWVALGVGGRVMNGSRLFIGYDTGAKKVFTEQLGAGHSHGDVSDKVVSAWAVKLADGTTTLEFVLPAKDAISKGNLDLLYAYSTSTSFMARHRARGSMTIPVSQ